MRLFRHLRLLCVSLLFSLACIAESQTSVGALRFVGDGENSTRYSTQLSFKRGEFSGILLMKMEGDTILGSLVNEFGIKAFDFTCKATECSKPPKVKLLNVLGVIDKWYIRKVISDDLGWLFCHSESTTEGKRTLSIEADTIRLDNDKYHVSYSFTPLITEDATVQ